MTAVWTPPITWLVDQLVTEQDLNEQVRDNLEFLYVGLVGYVLIRDEKTQGTDGGTFSAGAWQTRDLNAIKSDAGGHAALAANQITLAAGVYRCRIQCPAYQVAKHQARLYSVTDGLTLALGSSQRVATAAGVAVPSIIIGRFTLSAPKVLEVQHRCETTMSASGFGIAANLETEVYTIAEFWKES
ncbi:MAG: hypothetical protein DWB42_05730 [Chloroflexi bacterium]|nr:hypothetical protein [Chloroflexota bacterium]